MYTGAKESATRKTELETGESGWMVRRGKNGMNQSIQAEDKQVQEG